jgi:hypothetical protein
MHNLYLLPFIIIGQIYDPGATGYTFLKLGVGIRPVAMGNAFTALSDDGNAVFWNPAGLGIVESYYVSGMAMNHLTFINYYNLTSAIPIGKPGGIGFGLSYLTGTDVEYSERGEPGEEFKNSDMLLNIGYGKSFKRRKIVVSFGSAVKAVRSQLYRYSAYGVLLDGGVILNIYKYLYFGTVLKNFGTPRKFIERWEYPPLNFRQGFAFKLPFSQNSLALGFDYSVYPDVKPTFSFGGEVRFRGLKLMESDGQERISGFSIMGGYQSGYEAGAWSGFSFGFSVELTILEGLYLDIAALLLSYGDLGSSERIALGLNYTPSQGRTKKSRSRPGHSRQ